MLKRMILINSANFQFADIDLSKEVFFVGDNASGKTTSTRALHFLYNSDGQKLGIPRSKDSFLKHYFPNDDSYIIYVFETFFIFTYARNNTIRRWFSKQEFDIDRVIKDGELFEFETIQKYIKSASLRVKPQTIDDYTRILYGNDKKYVDFAIAKIENYKIFLDVFNMIFNIDKAIVTASDIKRAIQKSLDRKDETLSIDYEDFIRKLNGFSKSYHFFKIFDNSRNHLKNALLLKNELLNNEKQSTLKSKAINYRYAFEIEEFNKQKQSIDLVAKKIKKHRERFKNIEKLYDMFDKRVSEKIKGLQKEISKLEYLKDKFDPLEVEDSTLNASKYDGIKKELDDKKFSLQKLKEKQTSAQKEIQNQIEQINYKIKTTIPNELKQRVYKLSEIEKSNYENELFEIKKEFLVLEDEINQKTREFEYEIEKLKGVKSSIDLEVLKQKASTKKSYENEINLLEVQKKSAYEDIDLLTKKIRELKTNKFDFDEKYKIHCDKYQKLRDSDAKTLASKRAIFNNKILNAKAILNPAKNSFNEFLSNEIDGWESEIYPIIDKDLLKKSCDELNPEIIDATAPIGFKINTNTLESIPTKDEALKIIEDCKNQKSILLKNFKEVYRAKIAKLDEEKNELLAKVESCKKEIDNSIQESSSLDEKAKKISNEINEKQKQLSLSFEKIEDKYKQEREDIAEKIISKEDEIKSQKDNLKELSKKKKDAIDKNAKKRDFNIEVIKKQEIKKANEEIKEENSKKNALLEDMKSLDEDDMIQKLSYEVSILEKELKISSDAIRFLEEYEEVKDEIQKLPLKQMSLDKYEKLQMDRKELFKRISSITNEKVSKLNDDKQELETRLKKYDQGIKKVQSKKIEIGADKLETEELLIDLVDAYEDIARDYANKKSKFRELIDKLKRLEVHSIIELNFSMDNFDDAKSISELENIIDSLNELNDFEKNKYESEKKRTHNNFNSFLRNTIPGKLQSFNDLENEFEKAKVSINKSLSHADFGVIRDIKLITDNSKNRNNSISTLLHELSKKVQDTIGLYSNKSLFYFDISKSVGNIEDIQNILQEIKKQGSSGPINLFDTIDLSISYIENGKKVQNKLNIKDESSSGGNILLKVAIAMSILNRYARKTPSDTPFFLIIDEISKLQSKNQDLIRKYINENGFKTLFITPDPAYPDPSRAIYYTFKNIQEEGETLEIRQMNII